MKTTILFLCFALISCCACAQEIIPEATIQSSLSVTYKEKVIQQSSITTYMKDSMLRLSITNAQGNNDVYIDRHDGRTVTLFQVMGKKLGFYIYDTSVVSRNQMLALVTAKKVDSSKVVNGFNCQLMLLQYDPKLRMNDAVVWYTTDFRFSDATIGINVPGIEKVEGAPILLISDPGNGMTTTYSVFSVDKKAIDKTTFQVPKDYDITSQADFQKAITKLTTGNR